MNNEYKENSIGIDPTQLEVIEHLDATPKEEKKPKESKGLAKKSGFIILIVALILLVGGGLFFYLRLGTNNKKASTFVLSDMEFPLGLELPSDVGSYGTFDGIDLSKCTLDVSNVDVNTAGDYNYSVTCVKNTKAALVTIVETSRLRKTTKLLVRRMNSLKPTASDFIEDSTDLQVEYDSSTNFMNSLGLKVVPIKITNKDKISEVVNGLIYIVDFGYSYDLTCSLDNKKISSFFNNSDVLINKDLESNIITYNNADLLALDLAKAKSEDGKITIQDISGYPVVDYTKLTIELVNEVSHNEEVAIVYEVMRDFYQDNGYTCNDVKPQIVPEEPEVDE